MRIRKFAAIAAVLLSSAGLPRCGSRKVTQGNQPPSAASVTPSSGSGPSQVFSYLFSDPDGSADIAAAQMLIQATLSPANSCYMHFEPATSRLWLTNDSGVGSTGPITLGGSGTLQNSQCIVDAVGSSSSASGNNLTVNVALTFKPAFSGAKANFMAVSDTLNQTPGWQARGNWTVP